MSWERLPLTPCLRNGHCEELLCIFDTNEKQTSIHINEFFGFPRCSVFVDPDLLDDLLGLEAAARRERYLRTQTRLARVPFHRTREQFDFGFQPPIDERQIGELATLAFVADAANAFFLGPPGIGKMVCHL